MVDLHISSGLVTGLIITLINYYFLNLTIIKGTNTNSKRGIQALTLISFFIRLTILGALIYLALVKLGVTFVLSALVGMTLLKVVLFIAYAKKLISQNK